MFKKIIFGILFLILIYTRFVGLDWGLPYPMHPDERNMAVALQQLNCKEFSIFNSQFSINFSNLKLQISNCWNPHFFAYGQLPLYLGRLIVTGLKLFDGDLAYPVSLQEAIISLRIISAVASLLNALILWKIISLFLSSLISNVKTQMSKPNVKSTNLERYKHLTYGFDISHLTFNILLFCILIFTFSPYMIQFSHFGTTESLLMLFYSTIIYYSLKILSKKLLITNYLLPITFFSGLSIATKVSAIIFLAIPILAIIIDVFNREKESLLKKIISLLLITSYYLLVTAFFSIIFSPHNIINLNGFLGSMRYESDVALGQYVAFYTRQFIKTIPILFQTVKVFPYALGWPQFILGILGFLFLPWKNQLITRQVAQMKGVPTARRSWGYPSASRALAGMKFVTESVAGIDARLINFLRFTFLIYFLPNALIFAKWTRFMAPILPILSVFAVLFFINIWSKINSLIMSNVKTQMSKPNVKSANLERYKHLTYGFDISHLTFNILLLIIILVLILPGIAYLSIYRSSDVRFTASDWVYKNIPSDSKILSETANVVDIPISPSNTYPLTPNYNLNYISFNFYDLEENINLQQQLEQYLQEVNYIFIPSRRIWANHTCLQDQKSKIKNQNDILNIKNKNPIFTNYQLPALPAGRLITNYFNKNKCNALNSKYPLLNQYYSDLLSGRLDFELVAEFTSYPKISFFGKTLIEFPDEQAEETWSVFDHPVIRIYKRNPKSEFQNPKQIQNSNFQGYQITNYQLLVTDYRLLIADTPEKWEKGLMNIRSKDELGGADGMIFLFPDKQLRTFWNKNTYVDLDLYWLSDNEVVGKDYLPSITQTNNITTINSPKEVNEVIEIIK